MTEPAPLPATRAHGTEERDVTDFALLSRRRKAEAALGFLLTEHIGALMEERRFGPGYIAFAVLEIMGEPRHRHLVSEWMTATRIAFPDLPGTETEPEGGDGGRG